MEISDAKPNRSGSDAAALSSVGLSDETDVAMASSVQCSATETAPKYAPTSGKRIPELDGLRGIAIVLVLIWHYFAGRVTFDPETSFGFMLKLFWKATSMCWAGVDLFFVLSGFLIGGILIATRERESYFRTFLARRSARIFPAYFLLLIIVLLVVPNFTSTAQAVVSDNSLPGWSYWTYTQNFLMASGNWGTELLAHTWSLAVEEQFYLILPILVFVASPRMLPYYVSALILMAITFRIYWLGTGHHLLGTYLLLFSRGDSLLLGVLTAYFWQQPTARQWITDRKILVSATTSLVGIIPVGCLVLHQGIGSWGQVTIGHTALALFSAGTILCAVMKYPEQGSRFLKQKWLRYFGQQSYSIYLWHMPVLVCTYHIFKSFTSAEIHETGHFALTIFALIGTLIIARASWLVLELPCQNWGRKFVYGAK